ncbi:MAG: SDR family oxidoreductase [Candidatus Tectomicrobia bacterium]|nr:SDR family oxidoreductase [Candidatus Tectomicrobia bacterium]
MNRRSKTALIIGATSDIGRSLARALAREGYGLQLAARNSAWLEEEACDLRVRGEGPLSLHRCDVLEAGCGVSLIDGLDTLPDVAVCVVGLLGEQDQAETDPVAAQLIMRTNFEGPALLMGSLARRFEERGHGVLVGISSVAGDRGRRSNYVYGSAKAAFTAFLSGLRNRLWASGVRVLTVKPGYVRTRMTEGMDLPRLLVATPEEIAEGVLRAISRRRDVIYIRPIWNLVMLVVRAIPEGIFKRLKL